MTEAIQSADVIAAFQGAGYTLMPLKNGAKIPRDVGWREQDYSGFDAQDWLDSGGNLGVRLGPDDLVIDVDPRNGGDQSFAALNDATLLDIAVRVPTVITGGGGRHLYLKLPPEHSVRAKLAAYPGVDFKSAGGFVVAPGSTHPDTGRVYAMDPMSVTIGSVPRAPEALLGLVHRPPAPERTMGGGDITPEQLQALLAGLDARDFGQGGKLHDRWLDVAMAAHDATNGDGEQEWLDWCATDPQYGADAGELNARRWESFTSGKPGGATVATLLKLLIDAGRGDLVHAVMDADDFPDDDWVNDRSKLDVWMDGHLMSLGQRDMESVPPVAWAIRNYLLFGDVTLLAGRGSSGKSLLAWSTSLITGLGRAWGPFSAPAEPRKVLILSGEDDTDEVERRIAAACAQMGVKRSDIPPGQILIHTSRDIGLLTRDRVTGAVLTTTLYKAVAAVVAQHDIGLLIVDPANLVTSGFNDSDNDDQKEVLRLLRVLMGTSKRCSMLVVEHAAKAGQNGSMDAVRGASAKVNFARVVITVNEMSEADANSLKVSPGTRREYMEAHNVKSNYGPKNDGGVFFHIEPLRISSHDEAPALVPVDFRAEVAKAKATADFSFEPDEWEWRDSFLRMVADGRPGTTEDGFRPWSAGGTAHAEARLDVALAQNTGMDIEDARKWIEVCALDGLIVQGDWKNPTTRKTVRKVWLVSVAERSE